jgi:hypothetical protein
MCCQGEVAGAASAGSDGIVATVDEAGPTKPG